ncbi:MAG TPA: heavy metal translocating P-type ATPase [Desulfuromonadaceae bacterium]|jgi:heavy metal translocating P-type ATPase
MQAATATKAFRQVCTHCGLPVTVAMPFGSDSLFCCYGCRMVAKIVGTEEQGEHSWSLLRLGCGVLLAMNIMMISLLLYSGAVDTQAVPVFRLVLLAMSGLALGILLPPFLIGATGGKDGRRIGLDALIAGGSLAAFSVSAVNTIRGAGEIYFDTATMLPVLVTFGKMIEAAAKTRASDLLNSLETLLPKSALLVSSAGSAEVNIDQLRDGDLIRVRPGERFAVDGRVLEGSTTIEEAAFTGEFMPRLCSPGDSVTAGTINGAGTLLVLAERTGTNILLHGIISMIRRAWQNPSKAERIAEEVALYFIPVVLLVAAGSVIGWTLLGNSQQGWLSALSVMVVACPCTIGIATPLATSLAVARAAKAGIVVRGGHPMEEIGAADLFFFDKTGTLTNGRPVLESIVRPGLHQVEEAELLGRLAALESASEHLLGRAVVEEAQARRLETGSASKVRTYPGRGISGIVTWQGQTVKVVAGTEAFVQLGKDTFCEGSSTAIDVAWGGQFRGRLLFADTLRRDAGQCIKTLLGKGIHCMLLSGDRFRVAAAVAEQVGLEAIEAPCKPLEKQETISAAIAAGRKVVMVGDGINDAPALAVANIGIAFGAVTDLARQAGNVVILSGRLMQIPWLINLSRKTRRIILGNLAWSLAYNAIAIAAAATGLLHPLLAAGAMVVSSLTVLGNSLRIMRFPDDIASG